MDYDGHQRLDFLTGSILGNVYLYRQKPDGTFAAPEVLQRRVRSFLGSRRSAINVGRSSAVAMADWFGSGKLDLFVGNGDGNVYLFRNEGTREEPVFSKGTLLTVHGQPIVADGGNAGPCVADWDGDGTVDLLLGCGSGRVVFYRKVGGKTAPELAEGITLVESVAQYSQRDREAFRNPKRSGGNAKLCVADWNGDGLPDLVVGDCWAGSVRGHGWVWVYLRKP